MHTSVSLFCRKILYCGYIFSRQAAFAVKKTFCELLLSRIQPSLTWKRKAIVWRRDMMVSFSDTCLILLFSDVLWEAGILGQAAGLWKFLHQLAFLKRKIANSFSGAGNVISCSATSVSLQFWSVAYGAPAFFACVLLSAGCRRHVDRNKFSAVFILLAEIIWILLLLSFWPVICSRSPISMF